MAKESILVIEDDEDILELISYNLTREGYQVSTAASGEDGLQMARTKPPNLILLDLMLPGIDGLEICKLLKSDSKTKQVPIIMVTAKGEDSDVVTGLELGAEDYITKPFSPKVLIARSRAVLRRKTLPDTDDTAVVTLHDMTIDPGRRQVTLKNKPVELTFTEFGILHLLASRPGWVFTRYQIVSEVRGDDVMVTDRTVDVQIVGLRKKLGAYGNNIETVRGVGYRMKE
jgi:two-component system alkaline phosphatase synthesis response regulator PhoP